MQTIPSYKQEINLSTDVEHQVVGPQSLDNHLTKLITSQTLPLKFSRIRGTASILGQLMCGLWASYFTYVSVASLRFLMN